MHGDDRPGNGPRTPKRTFVFVQYICACVRACVSRTGCITVVNVFMTVRNFIFWGEKLAPLLIQCMYNTPMTFSFYGNMFKVNTLSMPKSHRSSTNSWGFINLLLHRFDKNFTKIRLRQIVSRNTTYENNSPLY